MAVELTNALTPNKIIPLTDQSLSTLKTVFETITSDSCPRNVNFHMHTVHSDGRLTPEALMQQAIDIGLSHLAITDHHSIEGYRVAKQWLSQYLSEASDPLHTVAPKLWIGVEVNAQLLDTEVHILCYGFDPDYPGMAPYFQGATTSGQHYHTEAVINFVHEAGGVAVLAHPNRYRRSPKELIPEAARLGIDGVETYYAYDNPLPWRPSPKATELVHQLGEVYGLFHTCGTDTHGLNLLQRL